MAAIQTVVDADVSIVVFWSVVFEVRVVVTKRVCGVVLVDMLWDDHAGM
jgi:hypothetical protein